MRLRHIGVVLTLALSLLAAPLAAEGQQAGKVARIGFLGATSASAAARNVEAFRQGLRELGRVEGQNIAIEYRWAEGRFERFPALAAELVRLQVDVIVAPVAHAALAAKEATKTIPIVTVVGADPELGLVASLARPGGNITGLSFFTGHEIVGKLLELFKEAIPKLSRVAVLGNPANQPLHTLTVREVKVAAQALGVRLQILEARGPDEFESAFLTMTRERPDGLLVLPDVMLWGHRARLADLAARSRLPTMFGWSEGVEAGGLMSYGASLPDLFRRAATFVDKILKGTKPADLPVERPTKFELIINLKTAKALGLTIPQSVLFRADHVIQ